MLPVGEAWCNDPDWQIDALKAKQIDACRVNNQLDGFFNFLILISVEESENQI